MSNGYVVAAQADLAIAHEIGEGFGLDVIDAAAIGDVESVAAALAGAANVGLVLSPAAAGDERYGALLRVLALRLGGAQLIATDADARALFAYLPAAWPVLELDEARRRADRRRELENAPRAAPIPTPEPAPIPEPESPAPQAEAPPLAADDGALLGAPDAPAAESPAQEDAEASAPIEPPAPIETAPEDVAADDLRAEAETPAIEPPAPIEAAPEDAASADDPVAEAETPAPLEAAAPEPHEDIPAPAAPEEATDTEAKAEAPAALEEAAPPPIEEHAAAPEPPPAPAPAPSAEPAPAPIPAAGAAKRSAPARESYGAAPPPTESAPADATAFAPKKLRRGTPELLRIVVHQPKDLKAIIKAARKIDPRAAPAPQGVGLGNVAFGARIGIALDVRGAVCDGALQRRAWAGEPIDFSYTLEAEDGVKQVVILARLFVNDAQIGVIAFTRGVSGPAKKPAAQGDARLTRHKRVFLSYSSQDRETVSAIATAYQMAGVAHFWDRASLKSGEEWSPRLRKEIDRADLFHLCWSRAAAQSEWVEKEATHALTRRKRTGGKKPEITVQMLDGPPWAKHPESLDSINFDDFVRAAIVGYARGDGQA